MKSEGRRWPGSTQDQPEKSTRKAAHNPVLFFHLPIQKPVVKLGIRIRNATEDPFFHISHRNAQENAAPRFQITAMLLMIGRKQTRSKRTK